jgi:class 3 adenylate cyclase
MSQRLQQLADAGETVVSQGTVDSWRQERETFALPPQLVKGRDTPVIAYKLIGEASESGLEAMKEGV